jgi:hypothetical protein
MEAKLYVGLSTNLGLKTMVVGTVLENKVFMTRIIFTNTIDYKSGVLYINQNWNISS